MGRAADRQRGGAIRNQGRHQTTSARGRRGDIRSGQSGNRRVVNYRAGGRTCEENVLTGPCGILCAG